MYKHSKRMVAHRCVDKYLYLFLYSTIQLFMLVFLNPLLVFLYPYLYLLLVLVSTTCILAKTLPMRIAIGDIVCNPLFELLFELPFELACNFFEVRSMLFYETPSMKVSSSDRLDKNGLD